MTSKLSTTSRHGPWPIDVEKLRQQALKLEAVGEQCAQISADASAYYDCLKELIRKAKAGQITSTLDDDQLPGTYIFMEGSLQGFHDFHNAVAAFKINLSFGESERYKRFQTKSDKMFREMLERGEIKG